MGPRKALLLGPRGRRLWNGLLSLGLWPHLGGGATGGSQAHGHPWPDGWVVQGVGALDHSAPLGRVAQSKGGGGARHLRS